VKVAMRTIFGIAVNYDDSTMLCERVAVVGACAETQQHLMRFSLAGFRDNPNGLRAG